MKAVIYEKYGSPDVLEYQEVNKPAPKDNEVLIKVYATTVTVADFRSRSFTVPLAFWLPARITLGLRKPKKPSECCVHSQLLLPILSTAYHIGLYRNIQRKSNF
ncbi:MAG TPA: hypothetical protein VF918_14470 [Anaerolineales bacterium]